MRYDVRFSYTLPTERHISQCVSEFSWPDVPWRPGVHPSHPFAFTFASVRGLTCPLSLLNEVPPAILRRRRRLRRPVTSLVGSSIDWRLYQLSATNVIFDSQLYAPLWQLMAAQQGRPDDDPVILFDYLEEVLSAIITQGEYNGTEFGSDVEDDWA